MLDILLPLRQVRDWHGTARYAAELAAQLRGALTGMYLHEPLRELPQGGPPTLLDDAIAYLRELLHDALRAGPEFERWSEAYGLRDSQWRVATGTAASVLPVAAAWQDLLVLERPDEALPGIGELADLIVHLPIPCLLVPPGCTQARLDTIALAWNGSNEALRAIRASLPLLQGARRVVLLRAKAPQHGPRGFHAEDIADYLRRHGIATTALPIDAGDDAAGAALLAAATQAQADLLVMGAYGRSRFSEWALGGATRHVLGHATLPVLMRH